MNRRLGLVGGGVLLGLPLAAFLAGPALSRLGVGEGNHDLLLLSWLPTILPLMALVFVAVVVFRRTGNALRATVYTAGSLGIGLVGALVYLLLVWGSASGS
jgi:hypothetical protein